MSDNQNSIDLLKNNLDRVDWHRLCGNPNSVHILEQNPDESKGNGITDQNDPDFDWGVEGEDWEWEDEGDDDANDDFDDDKENDGASTGGGRRKSRRQTTVQAPRGPVAVQAPSTLERVHPALRRAAEAAELKRREKEAEVVGARVLRARNRA